METPGDRLRLARKRAGYDTIASAAEARRFHRQNLADHESGRRKISPDQAMRYSKAFGVLPQWIMFGDVGDTRDPALLYQRLEEYDAKPRMVPIIGEVHAGTWTEPADEERIEGQIPVLLPAYVRAHLFALRVTSKSDAVYQDGTIVVVCPPAEAGVRDGDHVIFRRTRNGLIENSIKEVSADQDGLLLKPLCRDVGPKSVTLVQQAFDPEHGTEIFGVIVASVTTRGPRNGPLLL